MDVLLIVNGAIFLCVLCTGQSNSEFTVHSYFLIRRIPVQCPIHQFFLCPDKENEKLEMHGRIKTSRSQGYNNSQAANPPDYNLSLSHKWILSFMT
jgi:hypothetical protein